MVRSHSFELLDKEVMTTLGVLATQCGTRPSQLLGWNEPEDWYERLVFDIKAVALANKAQYSNTGGKPEWPIPRRSL